MPAMLRICVFLASVAAISLVAFLYSRKLQSDPATRDFSDDPVLTELRTNNPHLVAEDGGNRSILYWVQERSTGRGVELPKDEATGARIRFTDCDLERIPASLLYPSRTNIICFEVRNEKHVLAAYYFETKDRLARLVDFFEQNVEPDNRISSSPRTIRVQRERRKSFTHEFIVSYLLQDERGFVGYREEKNPIGQQ